MNEILEVLKKKSAGEYVPYWITSFSDLDKYSTLHEAEEAVYELMVEYISIFQNIMQQTSFTLTTDLANSTYDPLFAVSLIQDATNEYISRLKQLPEIKMLRDSEFKSFETSEWVKYKSVNSKGQIQDAVGKVIGKDEAESVFTIQLYNLNAANMLEKSSTIINAFVGSLEKIATPAVADERIINKDVMLFKDNEGNLRWAGVVTNIFKDRDSDIITEEAHLEFIDALEKDAYDYPELWIWHIEKQVGTTDYVAYDERGFVIASGIVLKEFEPLVTNLVKNTADLGMSHGMPNKEIKRYQNGKLKRYRSKEFSLLPLDSASNLLTYYQARFEG